MAREEFAVVLEGLDLSDEQRETIDKAIQKAVLDVLPKVEWRSLEDDHPPEMRSSIAAAPPEALPRCGIRPRCRWFAQNGRAACEVCPLVVTDLSPRS